jgi:hypothetical protein
MTCCGQPARFGDAKGGLTVPSSPCQSHSPKYPFPTAGLATWPFPVKCDGKSWRTPEALFQALRFDDDAIREEIRAITSSMGTKFVAKREKAKMVVVPQSEQDVANMEMVPLLHLYA